MIFVDSFFMLLCLKPAFPKQCNKIDVKTFANLFKSLYFICASVQQIQFMRVQEGHWPPVSILSQEKYIFKGIIRD